MIVNEAKRIRTELNELDGINFRVKSKRTKTPRLDIQITSIDEKYIKDDITGYGLDCILETEIYSQIISIINENQEIINPLSYSHKYNYVAKVWMRYNGETYGRWTHW